MSASQHVRLFDNASEARCKEASGKQYPVGGKCPAGMNYLALVLLTTLLLNGCSGMFFFPARHHVQTPDQLELNYQDIQLTAADGTELHAWLLPAAGLPQATILFLHGNAENISTHIQNVRWLPAAGYQVLLLDYRGFGNSEGAAELPEIFLDIDAALDWINTTPTVNGQPLFLLGQSIGASLMLYSATRHIDNPRLCGLISDAAFTRYSDITRHVARQSWLTWPLQYPLAWMMSNNYDPIDALAELDSLPILFFQSIDDQVIPYSNLSQLSAAHRGDNLQVSTTGPHTATFWQHQNRSVMLGFLRKHSCIDMNKTPLNNL